MQLQIHDIFLMSRSKATKGILIKEYVFYIYIPSNRVSGMSAQNLKISSGVWQHRHPRGLSHNLRIYYKRLTKSHLNICKGLAGRKGCIVLFLVVGGSIVVRTLWCSRPPLSLHNA